MKKITLLFFCISLLGYGQTTLVDFESATTWTDFDGGVLTTETNPHKNADNNSDKVGKMVKNDGQPWGGSWTQLASAIDFANNNTLSVKVYSPRVGAKVLLKVENAADANINFQKEVTTTKANAWETLTFDYAAINKANTYEKIIFIFDNGTKGDGTANFTFYIDDVILLNTAGGATVKLPIDFETATTWVDFDGGVVTTENNPHNNADNTSSKVGKMVKNAGQPWGGSSLVLSAAMDFNTNNAFKMKVYSPRANAKVLLKVENSGDANINYQKEVTMTKANAWEMLTFDYSGIDATKSYDKLVLIFDNGTMGDGTANFTFYFDDIELSKQNTTISEPKVAAKEPTVPSNGVASVFSDPYTDLANVEFNPNWGQTTTMTDFMIGNDNMKKYSNMNFTGINLGTQVDATANSITHFHVDVWSADFTEFKIKIVDFGPNGVWEQNGDNVEHELIFSSPTKNSWVSYDIPLSDFTGLTTKDHIAQIVLSSSAGATVYVDNIYFYNSAVLSTDDVSQVVVKAYPNPVKNNLTILAKSTIQDIEIFNILGKKVASQRIDNTTANLDVSGLNSGVYIVKYTINNLVGTRKFIKQ